MGISIDTLLEKIGKAQQEAKQAAKGNNQKDLERLAEEIKKLATYVVYEEGNNKVPFAPSIKLTEDVEQPSGSEELSKVASAANSVMRAQRYISYKLKRLSYDTKNRPVIVSEGDSWFQYPVKLTDTIDWLVSENGYAIYSLGAAGDELQQMYKSKEYLEVIKSEEADIFLLSGGGNDFLGPLPNNPNELRMNALLLKQEADTNAETLQERGIRAQDLINQQTFKDSLHKVVEVYHNIVWEVLEEFEWITVIGHGYDFLFPGKNATWLSGPLKENHIPKAYWRPIMKYMITAFNLELKKLVVETNERYIHIDCRNVVGAHNLSWFDEIHPTGAGFKRVAKLFAETIEWAEERDTPTLPARKLAPEAKAERIEESTPEFGLPPALSGEGNLERSIRLDRRREIPGAPAGMPFRAITSPPTQATSHVLTPELKRWREGFDDTDREAFRHYQELYRDIDKPESPKRIKVRESLRSSKDEYSLERIIGNVNIFPLNYLNRGLQAAQAIGLLSIHNKYNIPFGRGTGFLVGPHLLLTNHHVLPSIDYVPNSHVLFAYEYDLDNQLKAHQLYTLNTNIFFTNKAYDFTFVGVSASSRDGQPLSALHTLPLIDESGKAIKKEPITIIQHAHGQPKQIALRDSFILGRKDQYLYYTTDTNPGSSGAPVLSDEWFPVALHHRSVPNLNVPNQYAANRGIRISSILKKLRQHAVSGDKMAAAVLQQLKAQHQTQPPTLTNERTFASARTGLASTPPTPPTSPPPTSPPTDPLGGFSPPSPPSGGFPPEQERPTISLPKPIFEGYRIQTHSGDQALVKKLLERVSPNTTWTIAGVGRSFEVTPPTQSLETDEVWDKAYKLQEDARISSVTTMYRYPLGASVPLKDLGAAIARSFNDYYFDTSDAPEDEQWALYSSKVCTTDNQGAWDFIEAEQKTKGRNIIIAHPDTGYTEHKELGELNRQGIGVQPTEGNNFFDSNTIDPRDDLLEGPLFPTPGHGTQTASVIVSPQGAQVDGDNHVTGVAPEVRLWPFRVTDTPLLTSMGRLTAAIKEATTKKCDIISMSLGGLGDSQLHKAIKEATQEGIIVLAAAGNIANQLEFVVWPAAYDECIAVAAMDKDNEPWVGTCWGKAVDLSAPGHNVYNAQADLIKQEDGTYQPEFWVAPGSGTSFAVALTAGAAALWLSYHDKDKLINKYGKENLSYLFKTILKKYGTDPHNPPSRSAFYGTGTLNVRKLLEQPLPNEEEWESLLTNRSNIRTSATDDPFRKINRLFQTTPTATVRERLCYLLQSDEDKMHEKLDLVGDELLHHLLVERKLQTFLTASPDLTADMAAAMRGNLERATSNPLLHCQLSKVMYQTLLQD